MPASPVGRALPSCCTGSRRRALLFLIASWAGREDGSIVLGILLALGPGGDRRDRDRPGWPRPAAALFRLVASTDSPELFHGGHAADRRRAGVVAALAGLSMALAPSSPACCSPRPSTGAPSKRSSNPSRALLLGVFFFSVGMHIELAQIWEQPLVMVVGVAALLVAKMV